MLINITIRNIISALVFLDCGKGGECHRGADIWERKYGSSDLAGDAA